MLEDFVGLGPDHTGLHLAVAGRDDHRLKAGRDPIGRLQNRANHLGSIILCGQAGQIRADRGRAVSGRRVAPDAADTPRVEEDLRPLAGIAAMAEREARRSSTEATVGLGPLDLGESFAT